MANTPAQQQAQITADIQAAATADLSILQAFAASNGASFNTVSTNLNAVANQMSDLARQQQVLNIRAELLQALADFQTLISTTTAAQTAVPIA